MQEVFCEIDGAVYTALQMEGYTDEIRNNLRGSLRCAYCGSIAHYRSRSYDGRRNPCFYSLPHGQDCDLTRQDSDPWGDDDEGRINHAASYGGRLVVKIRDDSLPENIALEGAVAAASDARTIAGSRGGRATGSSIQRGPQRILELLVSSPTFKTSTALVRFLDGSDLPVHSAFVQFDQADHRINTDHWHGFWGVLPYPTYWAYGRAYYFNFGAGDLDFRISLPEQYVSEILRRHDISSVENMAGSLFILFDTARISASGRFTADVISPNHIGIIPRR